MTKTSYLIGYKFMRIPDSPDSVTTIYVTEKEINLIKAMREVKSQDGTYEVQVITRDYPGLHEYHDTFKTNDQVIDVDESMEVRELLFPEALANMHTFESYIIISSPDNPPEIKKLKHYKCRNCGTIIDEDEYHREPYSSMCFCEYSPESRILNPFFIIKGDD